MKDFFSAEDFLIFWLLQSFYPLFCCGPWAIDIETVLEMYLFILISLEYLALCIVSSFFYGLHWLYKKLIWWVVLATPTYGNKDKI